MSAPAPLEDARAERFRAWSAGVASREPEWLRAAREGAFERYARLGIPTTRDEDWKYTNAARVARGPFLAPAELDAAALERARRVAAALEPGGWRLVFVEGRLVPELSRLEGLPAGARLSSLRERLGGGDVASGALEDGLTRLAADERHAVSALNTALFEDGVVLELSPGAILEQPVEAVFVGDATGVGVESHARLLVRAGEGSSAVLVERHVTAAGDAEPRASFSTGVGEIDLGASARLEHVRLDASGPEAARLGTTCVRQARDSHYASRWIRTGGALVRDELRIELAGEGAECDLSGLYVAGGREHADGHVFVHHAKPRCTSRQHYRSVLDGRARGVFTGRILVDEGAQGTSAHQTNRNLLLSDAALADTRPQLEIYADDVSCTHGATIGRLDEGALFYLRSRGLDAEAAEALLTEAFAGVVLDALSEAAGRELVRESVRERLVALTGSTEERS